MTMFGQNKPLASLSSTLLARKGTARPAMRPQGFGGFGSIPGTHDDLGWNDMGHGFDPNGYDPNPPQQQYEQPAGMPPVAVPQVLRQREALQEGFEASHVYVPSYEPIPEFEPEAAHVPESMPVPEPVLQPEPDSAVMAAPQPVVRPAPVRPPVPVSLATAARIGRETSAKPGKAAFTLRLDHDRHLRLRLASALQNISAQHLVTEALDAYLQSLPEVEELACQLPSRAAH
jgi:hypothetical protein